MYSTPLVNKRKPARHADRLINEARRRFLRLAPTARPGPQPENLLGLLSPVELLQLSLAHRWPPSPADQAHITGRRPPATPSAEEAN